MVTLATTWKPIRLAPPLRSPLVHNKAIRITNPLERLSGEQMSHKAVANYLTEQACLKLLLPC